MNREAISDLTIACEGEAREIIQNVENDDASANDVWQALKQEFQPEGIDDHCAWISRIDLRRVKSRAEKRVLGSGHAGHRVQIVDQVKLTTHKHDDVEMTAETLLKLPKNCSKFMTSCNLRRGEVGSVSLQNMTKDLQRCYKRTVRSKEQGNGIKGEREAF